MWSSFEKERGKLPCAPLTPFEFSRSLLSLFLQHLSRRSAGTLALQAELTQVQEAATAVEAACITTVLVTETSAPEASVAWDSVAAHVWDTKDWATLVEKEA
jgi:hypothetical protein